MKCLQREGIAQNIVQISDLMIVENINAIEKLLNILVSTKDNTNLSVKNQWSSKETMDHVLRTFLI
jgi:hypothetical protein